MKKWVEKLVSQFDFEWSEDSPENGKPSGLNEDRATLLFMIDQYPYIRHKASLDKFLLLQEIGELDMCIAIFVVNDILGPLR